jgi:hypothetical protein
MVAAAGGHLEVIVELIRAGADLDRCDRRICVLILLLYMCAHTTAMCVLCPRTTATYVSSAAAGMARRRSTTRCHLCTAIYGCSYYCYICVLTLMLWVCPPLLQAWADAAQLRDVTPPPPRRRMDAEYGSEHACGVAASRQ